MTTSVCVVGSALDSTLGSWWRVGGGARARAWRVGGGSWRVGSNDDAVAMQPWLRPVPTSSTRANSSSASAGWPTIPIFPEAQVYLDSSSCGVSG